MGSGTQHGGRECDDLQNWLPMTSHEKPPIADHCLIHIFCADVFNHFSEIWCTNLLQIKRGKKKEQARTSGPNIVATHGGIRNTFKNVTQNNFTISLLSDCAFEKLFVLRLSLPRPLSALQLCNALCIPHCQCDVRSLVSGKVPLRSVAVVGYTLCLTHILCAWHTPKPAREMASFLNFINGAQLGSLPVFCRPLRHD